jgi:hypothetical protein
MPRASAGFLCAVVIILGFSASTLAQRVRLRGKVTPACTSNAGANLKFADIYGDGNIAVQGSYGCKGAFIYDITNPDNPVLASWYNPNNSLEFLEAIVIGNRGYFGSGTGGGGVHIVDLTNPYNPVLLGVVDSSHGNAHDFIHEMIVFRQNSSDYLIENYNSLSGNKILKVIDVTNPADPVFVRDINPTEIQWVHAMHIRGNRMFTSGWGNSSARGRTEIYDISNIAAQAPSLLGFIEDTTSTTGGNNMHSSWSSEDGNYLYSCRETANGSGDLRVYNISNPAQPLLVKSIGMNTLGLNAVTPHNPVVMGNYLYVSWYQAGLQVFDISSPANPVRIGQYDTFPQAFTPPANPDATTAQAWDLMCAGPSFQNALPTNYDGAWAVYPFLGQDKVLVGDLLSGLLIVDASRVAGPAKNLVSDFDADGRTDLSVYSPSTGTWTTENSSNGASSNTRFGLPTDKIQAGDFDGDGKSDLAVWRPSDGTWYVLGSTRGFFAAPFGTSGDVPVGGDYDGDGRTDFAVFRPSSGLWYLSQTTLGFRAMYWGMNGDMPLVGDYDGDGKIDFTVWRPSDRTWYISRSSSSLSTIVPFGLATDKPLSGDFDGDGKTDIAVYRPSSGYWYILNSQSGSYTILPFGSSGDIPVPADYDGDGKADIAVFRPADNTWYQLGSSAGAFSSRRFGQDGDIPSPASAQP